MLLYRLLLRCYPAGFRSEYGDEMRAVFGEKRRRATGIVQVTALWVEVVLDVLRHAIPLHADALRQDLRYAWRSFARARGFSLTVILVSALGIGGTTAVFTVVDRVLIRPLPFPDPDRLVRVWEAPPGYSRMEVSPPNYRDWLRMATSFEDMAAYYPRSANIVGRGDPERIQGAAVAAAFFPTLGVPALLGQHFPRETAAQDAAGLVVLSYGLWQRHFGGDPGALGRTVVLDDEPHVIVGVMGPEFHFPDRGTEFWSGLQLDPNDFEDRNDNSLEVVARLERDVTLEMARNEMRQVMRQLEVAYPMANERRSATVNRLRDEVSRQSRLLLVALMGASFCVLLIACMNLANLLLARTTVRRQELAIRGSLGAGRQRLVRQLLTESVTLATVGGAVGVFFAYAALPLLARLVPPTMPVATVSSIDLRVLAFAIGVTALTGIGFGALPAARAGRDAVAAGLHEGARAGGGRGERVRRALVVVEVAGSVVLLIASGLLIRALAEVRSTDTGFDSEGVLTARTWLPWPRYASDAARGVFYSRVLDEVRALPGVEAAGYTSFLPMVRGGGIWPVEMGGRPSTRSENETASLRFVTPDYFHTLGIPLLRGRDVMESDTQDRLLVAVVSQSFVDRYWPGQDPIGRSFGFAFNDRTVVGVVDDVKVRGLERESEPQAYLPYRQMPDGGLLSYAPKDVAVRVSDDPMRIVPTLRDIVTRADPLQPLSQVQLLEDIVTADTASRGVQLRVLGAFALLAFLLAAVGIHGLLSFTATHRRREIGVRMALGAPRRGIAAMYIREGVLLGGLGALVGALLGYVAGRWMEALLFGIAPMDPVTFGSAVGLALVMTLVGSLQPALRAATIDPSTVMREG